MANKNASERWLERIEQWRSKYAEKKTIHEKIQKYFANDFPSDVIPVNLIFSFGRAMVPQLYFKNPVVAVNIARPGFEKAAMTLQRVDDALIKLSQLKQTIKKLIINSYCFGRGVGKCGFMDQTGTLPDVKQPFRRRGLIAPNRPWFLPFYPDDFAFDAQVSDFEDSAWQAMRFERLTYQIEKDELLKSHLKDRIKPDSDPDTPFSFWEIWDSYSGRFFILSEETNKIVGPETDIKVWPFYTLDFNWIPRSPIPVSDAELILKLQEEYNETKTQIHEHRRVSVLKLIARKTAFDQQAKALMEGGKVGPIVEVDAPPGEAVMEFKPSIPEALYTTANTTMDDIRDSIGYTRNQLAEFQNPNRTAREATIVQQAIMLRLDERRDMVADLIANVITAFNDHILEAWNKEDAAMYAGSGEGWEQLKEVSDEYTVNIVPDSTLPLGRMAKQQEAKEMYITLRGDPMIDQIKLRRKYLGAFESADETMITEQAAQPAAGAELGGASAEQPE